jgi:DNA repair protein RadC
MTWQVADASPQQWPIQRCLNKPSSMAIPELIQQICGTNITKAQSVVEAVCSPINWDVFRDVSAIELCNAGLTQSQTVKLLAALEIGKRAYTTKRVKQNIGSSEKAAIALIYEMGFSSVEKVAILVMDVKNNLIAKEVIGIGSFNECLADPKVIFERILRNQGSRFILAHCHPSGDPKPSPSDIRLTRAFIKASKLLSIEMVDHIVIAQDDFASIRALRPKLWGDEG